MSEQPGYTVAAFNTATASTNKIHDDTVAQTYGFRGGLVPGVDVYAYLTHVPAERWGLDWLRHGAISARFVKPVYDGDTVQVEASTEGDRQLNLALCDSRGDECATAVARRDAGDVDLGPIDHVELPFADPDDRPAASHTSLAPGTVLAAVEAGFHADRAGEYLRDVREALDLYRAEGVAHPGWLLRMANTILATNVGLGPWIHVSSDVRFLDVVRDGSVVEARARVVDEYERKGHRFVVLDVVLLADGRPVQRIDHTAIYEPRRSPL